MVFVLKSAYKTIVMRFIRFLIVRLYELSRKIVDSTRDFALFWKFLIKTADKREREALYLQLGIIILLFPPTKFPLDHPLSHSNRMLRAGWMEEMM